MQEAAETAAEQARAAVQASQARVDAARRAVEQLSDRDEVDRLSSRIRPSSRRHQRDLDASERELASITLTDALMQAIETTAACGRAGPPRPSSRPRPTSSCVAAADLEVRIGGEPVTLRPGDTWSSAVSGPTGVDVAGVLSVRVTPGAPAATTAAALDAAQSTLTAALQQAGAADVAGRPRARRAAPRACSIRVSGCASILDVLTAEGGVDELRSRLSALQAGPTHGRSGLWDPATGAPQEPAALRAELDAATAAHQQAVRDCETHRKVAEEAAKLLAERGMRAARAKEKLQAAQAELAAAGQRLAVHRGTVGDDELAVKAEADAEGVEPPGSGAGTRIGGELAGHHPDAVALGAGGASAMPQAFWLVTTTPPRRCARSPPS